MTSIEGRYNRAIEDLLSQQTRDTSRDFIYPEVITPLKPAMLDVLETKEKAVVVLSIIGLMSYREIGEVLSCSHTHAERLLKQGLKKLRAKYGIKK